jgi:selenocysteine lyase/cysteine desulfurase
MDAAALRSEFPVLERTAYLNAGTCGPLPRAAADAARATLATGEADGRAGGYFTSMIAARDEQRQAYASLLGVDPGEVALTSCTSEGIVRVLAGLDLGRGDEILTSDQEHPGLLGPLSGAIAQRGVTVRMAPFAELAEAVGPQTRLVACSHVSWVDGELAPAALGELDVPVLLDGAQGVGAVATRPADLGCTFYAGSGQKWLCGAVGTGMLWIHPAWTDRVAAPGPTYQNLAEPARGLASDVRADAARHDSPALSPEGAAASLASFGVLAAAGWESVLARAAALAGSLAGRLSERGFEVAPRGETTLVSFRVEDPPAVRTRLAEAGVVVRDLPGRPWIRASVGAWNDESDLERLLDAL